MTDQPNPRHGCSLCGQPMPEGEEMFLYHGYSGPCPVVPATPSGVSGARPAPNYGSPEGQAWAREHVLFGDDRQWMAALGYDAGRAESAAEVERLTARIAELEESLTDEIFQAPRDRAEAAEQRLREVEEERDRLRAENEVYAAADYEALRTATDEEK